MTQVKKYSTAKKEALKKSATRKAILPPTPQLPNNIEDDDEEIEVEDHELSLNEQIEQLLGSKGYKNVEITQDEESIRVKCVGKKSNKSFEFNVNFSNNESNYCCGTYEVGSINISDGIKHLSEELKEKLIAESLQDLFDSKKEDEKVRMLYFTVPVSGQNGDEDCKQFILFASGALKAGFLKVAEFVNANSDNVLHHFIKYE